MNIFSSSNHRGAGDRGVFKQLQQDENHEEEIEKTTVMALEEGLGYDKSMETEMTPSHSPRSAIRFTNVCMHSCCAANSNFKEVYTTTDNAIIPLVGRSAGLKPFIPQR